MKTKSPVTHDYTLRYWGHDYVFEPVEEGYRGRMMGWGRGIKEDDFLILENGDKTTRYRVCSIKYYFDPKDMWAASVEFAPREESE